jgi:hypothetical protein
MCVRGGADRACARLGDSHLRAQVHKLDDQSLSITLDSRGSTRIVVRPCDANGLRDLIWKHIFRKVFETTYAEVRLLGRGCSAASVTRSCASRARTALEGP